MFPVINALDDLLSYIEGKDQFRVQEQSNGTFVVCYMLQDEDTFRGEHDRWYKECRGITFNSDRTIASRTLTKFQNVGECEETQAHNIPWDRIVRVMSKEDGSMITFVKLPDGSIVGKTKKTFTSAEAVAATEFLNKDPKKVQWVRERLDAGLTPTFEWTSPRFPIVLLYEKDELTLLHIRENVSGRYLQEWEFRLGAGSMSAFAEDCPFPIVENLINEFEDAYDGAVFDGPSALDTCVSWKKLEQAALTREGIEGWVIQADDGRMWKIKTSSYVSLHHSVTFTRYRDVARTVLEDKSDDLKGAFALTGRSIEPIIEIENQIFNTISKAQEYVDTHTGLGKGFNRTVKDMALALKGDQMFSQIMRVFKGQEVNWNEWYLKNHIDDHTLEVIPTGAGEQT
jgi:T4 RnlA family RNA ligase